MPDPTPRFTLGDLADRVLATADPAARLPLVAQLAAGTRDAEQVSAVTDHFLAAGAVGRRAFLEWVVRVRGGLPEAVVARVVRQIADRKLPVSLRLHAAARALRSLPDKPDAVRPVARRLTAGLSPLRGLERLRQLQHQMDRSRGLDALIERRELRVKMDCPRCGVRLPRVSMVRHLWHEHRLLLDRGKIRSPGRTVEELKAEHAATHDTTVLDRTALLADATALRAWTAVADPSADDVAPLRAAATDHRAGLCPGCFAELPAPVPPLPPPLVLAHGRLAGDGYTVAVGGAEWFRTLTVATPARTLRAGPDGGWTLGPRGAATLAAGLVLLAALAATVLLPRNVIAPLPVTVRAVLVAALAYGLVWFTRKPPPRPSERAVDAAWAVLARRLVSADHSARWLTRLGRASLGRGDAIARAGVLQQVIDRAATGIGDEELRLLAAAGVLQIEDGGRIGRDRMAGVAALAAEAFRGERPTEFAEYVAECFLDRDPAPEPADLARLRPLLLAAAFDAGLVPRDLLDLWAVAPNLRRAMAVEPPHRLGLLHGVWAMRGARRWERVAPAESVFDLARIAPNISGRVLAEFPDVLLYHRPDPDTFDQLGPVLVCARGVAVGGVLLADPDAVVRVVKAGRAGGFELVYGPHLLRLMRTPSDDFVDVVSGWLRFRATWLLPYLDRYLAGGSAAVAERAMRPFRRTCLQCGTVSAVTVGKVGSPVG